MYNIINTFSVFDYYSFGSIMPGRYFTSGTGYRYGFNGKEMDNEISGNGNQYDYGFRIYNPRIGKFLSVDPLTKSYPWYTPYQFAGNIPISCSDIDGLEPIEVISSTGYLTSPVIIFLNSTSLYEKQNLKVTKWSSYSKAKLSLWQIIPAFFAVGPFGNMDAITLDKDVVFANSLLSENSLIAWLGLIGHEQIHVEDYSNFGVIPFLSNYLVENKMYGGYGNETTEERAYSVGNALESWLEANPRFIESLKNKDLNIDQKNAIATEEGKKFRQEVGIDLEIDNLNLMKNRVQDIINTINNEIKNIVPNPQSPIVKAELDNMKKTVEEGMQIIKKIDAEIANLNTEKTNKQ